MPEKAKVSEIDKKSWKIGDDNKIYKIKEEKRKLYKEEKCKLYIYGNIDLVGCHHLLHEVIWSRDKIRLLTRDGKEARKTVKRPSHIPSYFKSEEYLIEFLISQGYTDKARKKLKKLREKYEPYLFSWDGIVNGNKDGSEDNHRLIKFLQKDLKIKGVENAVITKNGNGKTITVTKDKNSPELELNEKEGKVILKTGNRKSNEYTFKKEKGKLNIHKSNIDKRIELIIMQLRCERRRKAKVRKKNIKRLKKELENLYKRELRKSSESNIERVNRLEYEIAMIYFAEKNFEEASKLLRPDKSCKQGDMGGSPINEAQACVADFEDIRRSKYMRSKNMLVEKTTKKEIKEIEKIIKKEIKEIEKITKKEIEKIIEKIIEIEIEKIIENLEKVLDKLNNLASENPKKTIFSTWRVTARLHLARMKAYIGDENAMSWVEGAEGVEGAEKVKGAEKIRDEQNAETGWKSYTLVLLLHTKGECYRAKEEYEEAIKFLSLAARKILHEEYKNFEYLDNVLEGLLRIPKKRNKNLDLVRETIKKTREVLYD